MSGKPPDPIAADSPVREIASRLERLEASVQTLAAQLASRPAAERPRPDSGELEKFRDRCRMLEREKAALLRVEQDLRDEIAERTRQTAQALQERLTAREELIQWQKSRLWKTADLYWKLRRWFRPQVAPALENGGPPASPAAPDAVERRVKPVPRAPVSLPAGFPARPTKYDVVVFSIIDWDFRFQRPQQLATQLGRHGHRVLYLSTTQFLPADGLPWELAWKSRNVAELRLRSPRPLDIYGGRLSAEDLAVLGEALQQLSEDLSCGDVVALVQIPFWAPLAERLRRQCGWRLVYDCMDEWTNFPGFGPAVLQLEEDLVRGADVTVVSARRLFEKFEAAQSTERLLLVRNGVDLEHYQRYYGPNPLLPEVRKPILGYYGALASWVDVALLEKIALRFPEVSLVLAGGVFDVDLDAVAALPNVHLLGQRPYEEMPQLLWHFDACIIPFLVNDITEATNPVKFYEYLFAGKPVVAPPLTELLPFADLCFLAEGHDRFLAQIESALAEPADHPVRELRRAAAARNDWSERFRALDESIAATFPRVSVVIVTYGGLAFTRNCLDTLLAETWPRLEVLVVDNASPDGTPEALRDYAAADPRLRLFLQAENHGFAGGNNLGIAEARGEVLVLLNSDTVVPPGLIGRLVRHLQRDPALGLVVPTTDFCGNEARVERDYEDLADLPAFAAARARRHAGQVFDLAVAAMYCVAARREVWAEIGPLDEAFGLGLFEDDDYSIRARQAGYRVVCAQDAYVHHEGQGSFRVLPKPEYDELWDRNREYFETKWGRPWEPHRVLPGVTPVQLRITDS